MNSPTSKRIMRIFLKKNKEVTNEERNKIKLSYILPNKCNEY
nr:MAG TPA: hypothetical protein [Caudoviricetes sp.]